MNLHTANLAVRLLHNQAMDSSSAIGSLVQMA